MLGTYILLYRLHMGTLCVFALEQLWWQEYPLS